MVGAFWFLATVKRSCYGGNRRLPPASPNFLKGVVGNFFPPQDILPRVLIWHLPLVEKSSYVLLKSFHPQQLIFGKATCDIQFSYDLNHTSKTYWLGSSLQSLGRLIPGWGQAGQNSARSPLPGSVSKSCPKPNLFLLDKSRHCRDTLINSRYRF